MSEHTLTLTNAWSKPATTDANSTDLIYRDPNFSVDNDTYELVDDSTIRPRLYVYVGMWWNDLQSGGPGKEHDITTGKAVFETDDYEDMDYNYWEMNDEYESYHESLKKGIRYYENGKLVYIQEKYGRTSYFDDEEKLIRIEFMKGHWKHGCVKFYAGSVDKLIRIEYSKEYISDCHGEYGQVDFYDGDTLLKTMFTDERHPRHGEILYFDGNKLTRIKYSKDHKKHGEIQYYTRNELTWMNALTRLEYSKDHENHGEIRYYDGDKLIRIEYSKDHKNHGEICYSDGSLSKPTHKKKSKGPKSYCATCKVGSFVQQPDGWTCDNCFYKQNESPNLLSKSSGKAPTYYLDGEVPADKKRSEAETERLMDERKARRNATNRTDTSPKTSPSKVGKQKVSFADISVTNPSKQLCNDIVTAEQHKMEKQCPVCGTWSSRTLDNNHISCECGIQFCFLCLTRVKGHKDAATGILHFPTVCPQHGGDIVKPTAAALHKLGLGSSAKCLNMSEACFSVETNAIELGTFTNHAKERVEERGKSMFHVQTTKKYGEEVATMDSKGNASVMIVHRNKSGKVLGKLYENEVGSRVKTVV